MEDLTEDLKRHEPEVFLGIRTSGVAEDEGLEDFFNEKGFELIYDHEESIDLNGESGLEQHQGRKVAISFYFNRLILLFRSVSFRSCHRCSKYYNVAKHDPNVCYSYD